MFLDRSSLSGRLCFWGRPMLKALHSSRVSRSISGKDFSFCVPTASPRLQGGGFGLPLGLNRKHLAPDPQGERKPDCVGRVQTGTCCYFLPIPTPWTSSLHPMGISGVQNHIQSTELASLWRHCNHCNAEFIFPVTIQPSVWSISIKFHATTLPKPTQKWQCCIFRQIITWALPYMYFKINPVV